MGCVGPRPGTPPSESDSRPGACAGNREIDLWAPKTLSPNATWGVFVDQAAEPVPPQNTHTGHFGGPMRTPGRRFLFQRPVRPMGVVVVDVLAQDHPQVPLSSDQHPVQALAHEQPRRSLNSAVGDIAGEPLLVEVLSRIGDERHRVLILAHIGLDISLRNLARAMGTTRIELEESGRETWRQAIACVGRFLADVPLGWAGQQILAIGHVAPTGA